MFKTPTKAMNLLQLLVWSNTVPSADLDRYEFYRAAHRAVAGSGLYNPYEFAACSIELPNAMRQSDVPNAIAATRIRPDLVDDFVKAGFTVLDPGLYPLSDSTPDFFSALSDGHLSDSSKHLLDPYYGTLVFLDENSPKHLFLVHDRWSKLFRDVPPDAKSTRPSDALWQGVGFGQLLFADHLGQEARASYSDGRVPSVTVHDTHEFHLLVNRLVKWSRKAPKVRLWFRGQNQEYRLPDREALVGEGLAARWSATDASFVPSLYREIDRYSDDPEEYRKLVLEVGHWLCRAEEVLPPAFTVRSPTGEAAEPFPGVPDLGWSSHWTVGSDEDTQEFVKDWHLGGSQLQRGLILQHYGAPTSWLDITCDADVALWFANHRCSAEDGDLTFDRHTWDDEDPDTWPTVFVFALVADSHPMIDSGALLHGSSSLRPQRQRCGLLGAAGNLARNYPARYLTLRIRLHPRFDHRSLLTADYLFPSPESDSTLKSLLDEKLPTGFPGLYQPTKLGDR